MSYINNNGNDNNNNKWSEANKLRINNYTDYRRNNRLSNRKLNIIYTDI